jgi:HEAT repeat protein
MSAPKETQKPNPKRKLFFGLFLFPLLVAVGMAALLSAVVFLTHEDETPETLITAIKTGSPSKRWQKAFELSNELNRGPEMIRGKGVMKEIIHILSDPDHYDAKTRSYMAMALSRFKEPEAVGAIRRRLGAEEAEVQLYLIWALGNLEARESVPDLIAFLTSENPDLRKIAAYVLGVLGDQKAVSRLKPLLDDPVADVSWNAALSLARLGDDSGWDVLVKMLDRSTLRLHYAMSKDQMEKVMTNALRGLAELERHESLPLLESLAATDESLKVRQAAIEALKRQRENG